MSIDWIKNIDKTLIRCSSLSALFTEPKLKEDKLAGRLSQTAKTHLIEVYAREMWGVEKDLVTKAMEKGIQMEGEAIKLISEVDGYPYEKWPLRASNEHITGHPDVVHGDGLIDIKCSWDAFTFLPKLIKEVDDSYFYQVQGYMWLFDKKFARISYCLVDTPDHIIEGEKYKLLRAMDVVSEDSPEFKKAFAKIKSNMIFSQIPPQLRVINHYVQRDESIIEQIPAKVEKAREFLIEIAEKHLSLYKIRQ
jgi:hypothetical protein